MINGKIVGTGSYLPKKVLSNNDLERMVDTDDHWIVSRTGIKERRIAADDQAASDLALYASKEALEDAGITPCDLDLIIVATTTPDFPFPSTASILQGKIGAKNAAAFDIQAVCTGFVYALATANQFVRSGMYKKILVVGAEVLSTVVDWKDRSTCILFGDGAGAVVLSAELGNSGIISSHLNSDGTQYDSLFIPGGGSREPISHEVVDKRLQYIKMKGNEVFKLAVKGLEETAMEALEANGMTSDDIDLLVPHQANLRIIKAMAKRFGLQPEKIVITVDKQGNTSAASIPLALHSAVREGRLKEGDIVLLAAFGGGFTWGSILIRW